MNRALHCDAGSRPRNGMRHVAATIIAVLTTVLMAAACTAGSDAGQGSGTASDAGGDQAELTVFAAASLRTVLDQVGQDFEADNPGVSVRFSFAGSSDLITQLDAGAPADVLVTANQATMDTAVDAGTITAQPVLIATNTLVLVTPTDNPANITDLDSAAQPDVDLVVCAPQVPCGTATQSVADAAGIQLAPVSEENSVTDVLGKVTSGQADAGIVYATDAADAGDAVQTIDLPGAEEARTEYPAAITADTAHPQQAQAFVDFLQTPAAQNLLDQAGFDKP